MNTYNVHLYREMRLFFPGITAGTHEEAAQIAAQKPDADAVYIDECDGETLAALVDVIGDEEFEHSRMIRLDSVRDAAPEMLKALEMAAATGYAITIYQAARQHAIDDIARAESASSHLTQLESRSIPMSSPFHTAYLLATDRKNPHKPRTEAYELYELGRYYRQHLKEYEGIHRTGPGLYTGLRSGETFRVSYEPLSIEQVERERVAAGEQGEGTMIEHQYNRRELEGIIALAEHAPICPTLWSKIIHQLLQVVQAQAEALKRANEDISWHAYIDTSYIDNALTLAAPWLSESESEK